jgi:energy-coupling factor transporter ATP-binding protein EcfA2
MLKRLHLKNFTVFADADFEFSPGLNVLVGTNGTGKSHVLKVGYAIEKARFSRRQDFTPATVTTSFGNSTAWSALLYKIIPAVFEASHFEALIRWNTESQTEVTSVFWDSDESLSFKLFPADVSNDRPTSSLGHVAASSMEREVLKPVLIPAKEVLTLSWMLPGSEQIVIPGESNYLDLFKQLRLLPLRNPESVEAIQALTDMIGGEIRAEGDSYFLIDTTGRKIAASMIAEGMRKFGTLQKLLANGSLTKNNTLYWDEPEANLNPTLLRKLAAILAELAHQGFQIILATHSTDLLKEFHILSRQKDAQPLPIKYFGLNAEPGEATRIVSTDNFEHLPDVVALEAELAQVDELDAIFAREDRERHANL